MQKHLLHWGNFYSKNFKEISCLLLFANNFIMNYLMIKNGEFIMAGEALQENSVQDQWGQIRDQLKVEFGDVAFDSWLKP